MSRAEPVGGDAADPAAHGHRPRRPTSSAPRPAHMSAEEFRRQGRAVVDWVADYLETVEQRPVQSRLRPGDVRRRLPPRPPEAPEPFDAILADVERSSSTA